MLYIFAELVECGHQLPSPPLSEMTRAKFQQLQHDECYR